MKWTTWLGRRPIGAKSNSCDGATGSNNAPRENSSLVHSRANLPASFCAAWIFAIRLDRDQAFLQSVAIAIRSRPLRAELRLLRQAAGPRRFYFFLPVPPVPPVGCHPPSFWLGAAA